MPLVSVLQTAVFLFLAAKCGAIPNVKFQETLVEHQPKEDEVPKMKVPEALVDHHPKEEESQEFWRKVSEEELRTRLGLKMNLGVARNVLMFVGDGMSLATVAGARIYGGQKDGLPGEEARLAFEDFPHAALSKTYCVDRQVADSACSATAYLCGVKATFGTLGVTASVKKSDCSAVGPDTSVPSLIDWAQAAGKSTGIVTTTRVTHATPAGAYSHTANRDWESDLEVTESKMDPNKCQDIASQLVNNKPGKNINVILGGGRKEFLPENFTDSEGVVGKRKDGVNLIEVWKQGRDGTYSYVTNRDQLLAVDTKNTDYLLGLFSPSHMEYHLGSDLEKQPTLADMTKVAIEMLGKNPNGFLLFVEGGRIDHGHHSNLAKRALDETVEMSAAVRVGVGLTSEKETLTLVTADHSHTMTISGYPGRGQSLFSVVGNSDIDSLPYPTLSYANGPSYKETEKGGKRRNILQDNMDDINYKFPSLFPLQAETHGGEDVPVYSQGPWSHLLSGVMEQNFIPRAIQFASCMGPPGSLSACNFTTGMNIFRYVTFG